MKIIDVRCYDGDEYWMSDVPWKDATFTDAEEAIRYMSCTMAEDGSPYTWLVTVIE